MSASPRQYAQARRAAAVVAGHMRAHRGLPPTLREIGLVLGVNASTALSHVRTAVSLGLLREHGAPGTGRRWSPVEDDTRCPLCGVPRSAA